MSMKEPTISKQVHHVGPDRRLMLARLDHNRLPSRRPNLLKSRKKSTCSTLEMMSPRWPLLRQQQGHKTFWEEMVRHTRACREENELTVLFRRL